MSKKHALQVLCEELDGVEVRSYSGRGMFGSECLSVRNVNLGSFVAALVERAADGAVDDVGDVVYALERMQTDSMGHGIVIYFPDVRFWSEEDEDADEEMEPDIT